MAIDKPDSLFTTTLSESDLDPAYRRVRDDPSPVDREYVDEAWRFFRPLADNHFADQFPRRGHFHARAWELRLAWTLHRQGQRLTTIRPAGPDLTLLGNLRVHVEAVVPSVTEELLHNDRMARSGGAPVPEDAMILRVTGVIQEKRKQYSKFLEKGLVAGTEPFVIAVCGASMPHAVLTSRVPWILKPLFALGREYVIVELESDDEPSRGGIHHVPVRETANGAPVDAALFMDRTCAEISAVLFTPHHLLNRPEYYGRPPGNDFVTILNPFARNPLPDGVVHTGRLYGPSEPGASSGKIVIIKDFRTTERSAPA
jgi:hypothetical protein